MRKQSKVVILKKFVDGLQKLFNFWT